MNKGRHASWQTLNTFAYSVNPSLTEVTAACHAVVAPAWAIGQLAATGGLTDPQALADLYAAGAAPYLFASIYTDLFIHLLQGRAQQTLEAYEAVSSKELSHEQSVTRGATGLDVPALALMDRYIKGDNVHADGQTGGREYLRETELAYTIQEGALKDLDLRWRNITERRSWMPYNFDENRLTLSYPISLF